MASLGLWGIALLYSLNIQASQKQREPAEWLSHDQLAEKLDCKDLLSPEFLLPGKVDRVLQKILVSKVGVGQRFKLEKLIRLIHPKRSFYIGWGLWPNGASYRQRVLVRGIMPESDTQNLYLRLKDRSKKAKGALVALIRGSVQPGLGVYEELESQFISQFSKRFVEVEESQLVDFMNQHHKQVSDFISLQVWFYHENSEPFTEGEIANLVTAYEMVIKPQLAPGQEVTLDAYVVTSYRDVPVVYSTTIQPFLGNVTEVGAAGPEVSEVLDKALSKIKKAP